MLKNPVWVAEQQAERERFIPQALKSRKRWIVWKFENGKKVPYSCNYDGRASTTNPAAWCSYEKAVETLNRGGWDGLGYVFCEEDGFVFIDFDHVLKNGNIVDEVAKNVLPHFNNTYGEVSVSDSGAHLICCGHIPNAIKTKTIEMYSQGRYICLTGKAFQPFEPISKQAEIDVLYQWLVNQRQKGKQERQEQLPQGKYSCSLSAQQVIDKACASRGGDTFQALYHGDWRGLNIGDGSQSASDLSLMNKLCFWCAGDADMMMEIFRSSGLYRDDRRAKLALNRALQDCTSYYGGNGRK
jgi:primase-polymerase (primpol)-like protein